MKEVLDNTKERMNKCINALESELGTIRAGRANPLYLIGSQWITMVRPRR